MDARTHAPLLACLPVCLASLACHPKEGHIFANFAASPSGRWLWGRWLLKAGTALPFWCDRCGEVLQTDVAAPMTCGAATGFNGTALFDGDVTIPAVLEQVYAPLPPSDDGPPATGGNGMDLFPGESPGTPPSSSSSSSSGGGYRYLVWMSYTPMEVFTQRSLAARARGRTVVAGLGMGWLLVEAARQPEVTEVVLVERDEELVRWLLPRVRRHLPDEDDVEFTVVVGDVFVELPRVGRADVALVDTFSRWRGGRRLRFRP